MQVVVLNADFYYKIGKTVSHNKTGYKQTITKPMKIILLLLGVFLLTIPVFSLEINDKFFEVMKNGKASVEDIAEVVNQGARVNAMSRDEQKWYCGFYPVHLAAAHGRLDWFKYLESRGADIYRFTAEDDVFPDLFINNPNSSALHIAAYCYYEGSTELLDYLLQKGLDIDAYCKNGYNYTSNLPD